MFEFLPPHIKAIIGSGLMVLIGFYGFKLTSERANGSSGSNTSKSSKTSNSNKEE